MLHVVLLGVKITDGAILLLWLTESFSIGDPLLHLLPSNG